MPFVISGCAVAWNISGMTVSNRRLFRETDSRPNTYIFRERNSVYTGMCYAHRLVSVRDNPEPKRPQSSWFKLYNRSHLRWKGAALLGDFPLGTPWFDVLSWARRRDPRG